MLEGAGRGTKLEGKQHDARETRVGKWREFTSSLPLHPPTHVHRGGESMPKDKDNGSEEWAIGQLVRVRLCSSSGAPTCRATILTLGSSSSSSSTVDVLYEDGVEWAEGKEEEANVSLERLSRLLPFEEAGGGGGRGGGREARAGAAAEREETKEGETETVQALREQGNELIATCKDYGAALGYYVRAMEKVAPREGKGALRIGTYF